MRRFNILYIHGMGGGLDSRIPGVLKEDLGGYLPEGIEAEVIVRTYDIDPDIAFGQITSWFNEIRPDLVIGESLGSLHAIRLKGVPHILVSPAIGAARWMSTVSLIPGIPTLMRHIFKPYSPERQALDFTHKVLWHYRGIRRKVLDQSPRRGGQDYFFAFFGTVDHYRRSGVVSVRKWRKYFGDDSYKIYEGTHFMEDEYLHTMLIPKILDVLGIEPGKD
ncbi:MAG: hypothetical protein ACI4UJ_03590 [Candidatus Cryptobacteroides sp.]